MLKGFSIKEPEPSNIVIKILACNAVKPIHPPFKAHVIVVNVLDMIDTLVNTEVSKTVCFQAFTASILLKGFPSVRTHDIIGRDKAADMLVYKVYADSAPSRYLGECVLDTITGNKHRDLIGG